jgi:hypothetical protein
MGISKRSIARILICVGISAFSVNASQSQTCPVSPIPTITSSQVPADVCIPEGFGGNPIQFFDDYSWRGFVALVWPVANGQRGQPENSKTVSDPGPRVFETLKSVWEIFHNDGSRPAPWNTYDSPQFNACNFAAAFGDFVLGSFSKFSDLGQAGVGSLVGPLVAQNTTYTRYATGFNEIEFNQILNENLFLRRKPGDPGGAGIPMTSPFKDGALDVKSAWILMTDVPHQERYYTRTAFVLDPQTGKCSQMLVGLVGLHIVQKTPTRPQWIWSTFEQVDNVPPAEPGASGKFNYNDGKGVKMPDGNLYPIDPLILPTPAPFNVDRKVPINSSTLNTNMAYRNLLRGANSVWQFYQLVMTQWPTHASQPDLPGTPNNTFPGNNPTSAFANVTMETFDQGKITTGCMNCHNFTRTQTDFLWSLNDHAFPANIPNFLFANVAFGELQSLLKSTAPTMKLTPSASTQPAKQ